MFVRGAMPRVEHMSLHMDISNRAPPAQGNIRQVMAFVDDYLAEEERVVQWEAARDPHVARIKAATLTACRGAWEFLKAAGEVRARRDMFDVANSIAASRPALAARLRRAARESWAE